ncbi:hypothetical protein [Methylobacterium gnaphalii]|uniref:Uncharacterized protein n=1 Tax=Methylobacterium gnaphalii TaxID=1010610 RepID=A0A512JPB8_9HYPH|nr:hypothetical protein [Methylobacterium gnaphalii]GEP11782.1 hypothetical protein MGN01_36270 [Methylobacterium gnaphalii]GJD69459.1 hypothetical protein MMMDOFMJ_2390 [Methylobacterium gnaphalii]GLS49583.1 hypothetical protein GCM10007885_24320 [Methylobacterium gnaphalii]
MPRQTANRAEMRRQLAAQLGVKPDTLYHRERRARLAAERIANAPPAPSPWLGARISPPIEADHPSRQPRIIMNAGERPSVAHAPSEPFRRFHLITV